MKVFVVTLPGNTIALEVDPVTTAEGLKAQLGAREGVPPQHQRLLSCGRALEGPGTLAELGVAPESTLRLVLGLRGGMGGSSKRRHDDSSDGSSSDSSSSDSDSGEDRRKHKKHKKEKKSKHKKSKHKKDKHKKHKKEKKSKKHKKDSKSRTTVNEFGKYGIIMDRDRFAKQQEFYIWLRDAQNVDPEAQPKFALDEFWATYMEDYNTATLPHKKYYDLEGWERKEAIKKLNKKSTAREEPSAASIGMFSLLDEEKARRANPNRPASKALPAMSRDEILLMRQTLRERTEQGVKKDLHMKLDEKAGVRTQSMMRGLMAPGQKAVP